MAMPRNLAFEDWRGRLSLPRLRPNWTAIVLAMIFVATATLSSAAIAADPFDAARFDAAQRAGKTIIIGVHADWCPVCSIQKPIVADQLAKPEFAKAVHFLVDYDKDKAVLKRFNVLRQSTIIVLKGQNESGRLIGETLAARIEALLR